MTNQQFDHEKLMQVVAKKFFMMSIRHIEFEDIFNILSNTTIVCNQNDCKTMHIYFSNQRRLVLGYNSEFLAKCNAEMGDCHQSIVDLTFLLIWHEMLHVLFGHLALNPSAICSMYPNFTTEDCNIAADWQCNAYIIKDPIFENEICYSAREYFIDNLEARPNTNVPERDWDINSYYDWMRNIMDIKEGNACGTPQKFGGDSHGGQQSQQQPGQPGQCQGQPGQCQGQGQQGQGEGQQGQGQGEGQGQPGQGDGQGQPGQGDGQPGQGEAQDPAPGKESTVERDVPAMMGTMTDQDLHTAITDTFLEKPQIAESYFQGVQDLDLSRFQFNKEMFKRYQSGKEVGAEAGSNILKVTPEKIKIKLPEIIKDSFDMGDEEYHMKKHKLETTLEMAGLGHGLKFPEKKLIKKKENMCVFCDVSGSMSDNTLKHVMPIVDEVVYKHVKKIRMIYCDTRITRDFIYKKPEDLDPWAGGGGTCFEEAFKMLYTDGVRDIICYTDGYFSNFTIPNDLKVIWLLIADRGDYSMVNMPGTKIIVNTNR